MNTHTASPAVRKSAALLGVAGVLVLSGCSGAADAESPSTDETTAPSSTPSAADTPSSGSDSSTTGTYADGTYTAEGSYQTPETIEQISVTLTIEGDVVTDVEVTGDPQARQTEQYQGQFIDGIADEVVGVALDDLNVSRVAGSSLTSSGFNAAVEDIKDQAKG